MKPKGCYSTRSGSWFRSLSHSTKHELTWAGSDLERYSTVV